MQSKRTILITGIPRSGTTLCCHLLNRVPNTIALHEPIPGQSLMNLSANEAVKAINDFSDYSREQALAESKVQTKQSGGKIPSNPVKESQGELRREHVSLDHIHVSKTLAPDFALVIKHNALFTSLLNRLTENFACYAIIRNPLATMASWQTVDLPIHDGHVPMGEHFDKDLKSKLFCLSSTIDRQICILRWFFQMFKAHLNRRQVIRYEDIIESKGHVLSVMMGKPCEFDTQLGNQNASTLYQDLDINQLLDRLVMEQDIFTEFYTIDELKALAQEIRAL